MAERHFRVSLRAERQIEAGEMWWRAHRDKAPDAFSEDIQAAFERIRTQPNAGLRVQARRRGVRRLILNRIGYAVHYRVDDRGQVTILTLWHMSRRRPPRL